MNRGIEVSVNTVNVDNKNFKWNSTLTFAANHEEITDLIMVRISLAPNHPLPVVC